MKKIHSEIRNAVLLLQLFATQTTELNTTGNDLSPEMKTYYDKNLLYAAQAKLVHHQFGQKRPIPKNGGKTIEFRKFTPLKKALTPLTEGVTPAGNQLDVTALTATVRQYGDFIVMSDLLELTAIDNVIVEATRLLGDQAGLTMDTVVRDIIQAGTNVFYAPKVSGDTVTPVLSRGALDESSVLTVKLIERVATFLKAHNTPKIDGSYVCIVHPDSAYGIMQDPRWREPHTYQDTTQLYEGELGKIAGVRFVESSEAKIYGGADLASDSRELTADATTSGAITSIAFDGGTVEASALVGRKININGVVATVTANTTRSISFASTNFGTITDGTTKIYPGEGGSGGLSVYGTLIFGKDAYGVTEVEGAGLETIVKQKGSAGTSDPINQRSSVGWKGLETAEILMQPYMVRIEHCVQECSETAQGN